MASIAIRKPSRHRPIPKAIIRRKSCEKVGVGWLVSSSTSLLYKKKTALQRGKALPDNLEKAFPKSLKITQFQRSHMSDRRESRNKPLVILSNSADYPRWKSYAMSELRQQGCEWTVIGREWSTIDSIRNKLIEKGFTNAQLKPNILLNALMHDEEKYDIAMSKSAGILSKLVSDQHQPIIEGKTPEEVWNTLQERFQRINPMSTSRLIHDVTTKKLSDFKDVHESTNSYSLGRMRTQGSQRNLRSQGSQDPVLKIESTLERESWQPKVLAVRGPRQSCWLVDSAADVHVCNDQGLMTNLRATLLEGANGWCTLALK